MLFVYLLLLVASASAKSYPHRWYDLELADLYFEDFKNTHDRHYESAEEHDKRFQIFKQSLIRINDNNMRQQSYTSGITKFSDLTREEFRRKYTGFISSYDTPMVEFVNDVEDVPDSFDWRDKDMVSPVKNQGFCGSCWAFATTGTLESAARIQLGSQDIVSEQQILDCDRDRDDKDCKGGDAVSALGYIKDEAKGIESEKDYPYMAKLQTCQFNTSKMALTLTSFEQQNITNDEDIKASLVKYGPLAFALDSSALQDYGGGIMTCDTPLGADHNVLLIGYGSDYGEKYWIVKNSWGGGFGEKGFFRMKMDGDQCLMRSDGFTHAVVAKG